MADPSVDNEFMQYWLRLTVIEKESLLTVAKNYVQLKEAEDIADVRKKIIQEEREAYFRGEGITYNWEQVKQMALNKEQRNVL